MADMLEQCAENEGGSLSEQKALREDLRRATEGLNLATTVFAGRPLGGGYLEGALGAAARLRQQLLGTHAAAPRPRESANEAVNEAHGPAAR